MGAPSPKHFSRHKQAYGDSVSIPLQKASILLDRPTFRWIDQHPVGSMNRNNINSRFVLSVYLPLVLFKLENFSTSNNKHYTYLFLLFFKKRSGSV